MKLLIAGLLALATTSVAYGACSESLITISNTDQDPELAEPKSYEQTKLFQNVQLALRCHGDRKALPERMTMQFIWDDATTGQLCYQDRSCGNIRDWGGYVAVSGVWKWFDAFSDFDFTHKENDSFGSVDTDYDGGSLGVHLSVSFRKIESSCRALNAKICL